MYMYIPIGINTNIYQVIYKLPRYTVKLDTQIKIDAQIN